MVFFILIIGLVIGFLANELRLGKSNRRYRQENTELRDAVKRYEPIIQREAVEGIPVEEPGAVKELTPDMEGVASPVFLGAGVSNPDFDYDGLVTVLESAGYQVLSDVELFRAIGYKPEDSPDTGSCIQVPGDEPGPVEEPGPDKPPVEEPPKPKRTRRKKKTEKDAASKPGK